MDIIQVTRDFFKKGGVGERQGYAPSLTQMRYAEGVAETLRAGRVTPDKGPGGVRKSVCGIGMLQSMTGTGKGLAYYVPAASQVAATGKRIAISTFTIALLRQMRFGRDLEVACEYARDLIGKSPTVAMRIGRGNYVCRARAREMRAWAVKHHIPLSADAGRFFEWADAQGGLFAEYRELTGDEPPTLLDHGTEVHLAAETALRSGDSDEDQARYLADCGEAEEADIVLTTHHSLLLHGMTGILGDVDVAISDEADRLGDAAEALSGSKFRPIDGKRIAQRLEAKGVPSSAAFYAAADRLIGVFNKFREEDQRTVPLPEGRGAKKLASALEETLEAGTALEKETTLRAAGPHLRDELRGWLADLGRWNTRLHGTQDLPLNEEGEGVEGATTCYLSWSPKRSEGGFVEAPIFPLRRYSSLLRHHLSSWILTSATLDVRHNADDPFRAVLGEFSLSRKSVVSEVSLPPPDGFGRMSLVMSPASAPKPFTRDANGNVGLDGAWVSHAVTMISAAARSGRTLVLSRSFDDADDLLPPIIAEFGEEAVATHRRGERLDAFLRRSTADARVRIIMAPGAWEGVELRMPSDGIQRGAVWMKNLVIPRLPILPPEDVLDDRRSKAMLAERNTYIERLQKEIKRARREGDEALAQEYGRRLAASQPITLAVVNALIRQARLIRALRIFLQGVGRLIRGFADEGVLWICDPRFQAHDVPGLGVKPDFYRQVVRRYPGIETRRIVFGETPREKAHKPNRSRILDWFGMKSEKPDRSGDTV